MVLGVGHRRSLDRPEEMHAPPTTNTVVAPPATSLGGALIHDTAVVDDIVLALLNVDVADEALLQQTLAAPGGPASSLPTRTPTASHTHTSNPLVAGALLARRQREALAHQQIVAREDSVVRLKATRAKAGRRRQQRYQNNIFLKSLARRLAEDAGVDTDSREFAEELRRPGETEKSETPFDQLFNDWSSMEAWFAFTKMSSAEQERLLSSRPVASPQRSIGAASPERRYALVERHIRLSMRRHRPPQAMVAALEALIVAHFGEPAADQPTPSMLEIEEESSYHRMLLHGLCQYHGLQSHSVTRQDRRVMCIYPGRNGVYTPPLQALATWLYSTA